MVDSYFIRQVMLKSRSIFPSSLGHFLSLIHRQLVALSRKEMKCSNPAQSKQVLFERWRAAGSKTFFWLSKLESGLGAIQVDRKDNLPRPISIIQNRIPSKQRGDSVGLQISTIPSIYGNSWARSSVSVERERICANPYDDPVSESWLDQSSQEEAGTVLL